MVSTTDTIWLYKIYIWTAKCLIRNVLTPNFTTRVITHCSKLIMQFSNATSVVDVGNHEIDWSPTLAIYVCAIHYNFPQNQPSPPRAAGKGIIATMNSIAIMWNYLVRVAYGYNIESSNRNHLIDFNRNCAYNNICIMCLKHVLCGICVKKKWFNGLQVYINVCCINHIVNYIK